MESVTKEPPDERRRHGSRADRRQSFESLWRRILIIGAIGQVAFIAGMNWHRVDALTDRVNAFESNTKAEHVGFARADVVEIQHLNTERRLDELKALLEKVVDRLDEQRYGKSRGR